MAAGSTGDVVLSYHDSLLRESDVHGLEPSCWINDKIIDFIYEYNERGKYADAKGKFAYIGASVVQCIKLVTAPEEMGIFLEPHDMVRRQMSFLPMNSSRSATKAGGSHWSLLVYRSEQAQFSHYDSCSGYNQNEAQRLANRLASYISNSVCTQANFVEEKCPQQINGCDCGMYVIRLTEYLCERVLHGGLDTMDNVVTPSEIRDTRHRTQDLIRRLAADHRSTTVS